MSRAIGPYRLVERLGAGGMGSVYRAYDERLDRWVAVKLLRLGAADDAVGAERLRREARAVAQLNHPAVVQIYDLVECDGGEALVMELVDGQTVAALQRAGPLALPRALRLGSDVAEALAAAHARGIVHRDLKAENVLVTAAGRAKVTDFGISKRLEAQEGEAALTSVGTVIGTWRAIAPEQACGEEVDPRADLFSLGILLYEMLTGTSPFLGPNATATLHRVLYHQQPPARELEPGVPQQLSDLVDRLLAKEPRHRPGCAAEVALALAELAAATPEIAAAGPAAGPPAQEELEETTTRLGPPPGAAGRRQTGRALAPIPLQTTGERRSGTVVCCALVPADGRPLDPEELLAAQPGLQALAAEVADRFAGHAGPPAGPGCTLCFGYPRAHEDDARRAVRAARELVDRAPRLGSRSRPLAARVGVHSGAMVVLRDPDGGGELTPGEIAETAAWLQKLAGAGEVLVTRTTHRLIAGHFDCAELAPVLLPGAGEPFGAFRVTAEHGALPATPAAPLIGREQELGLLLARWALAKEGRGQALLLSGEAGIGKSRLVAELRRRIAADAPGWIALHGSPYHRHSAFHPLIEGLRRELEAEPDAGAGPLAALAALVTRCGLPPAEAVPPLASLLGLPGAEARYPAPPRSPDAQRRHTLETLVALLLAMAEQRPLGLAVEDLHWVDPSTLELLGLLLAECATAPLLLVLTFRPELKPAWATRADVTHLSLTPLSRGEVGTLIAGLTAGAPLAPGVAEQIAARTDGVPLFVEEMTRMILDSPGHGAARGPAGAAEPEEIPGTLQGWLNARLDRLDASREVAQLAAVLGREFPAAVLAAVSPWEPEVLQGALDRLVAAEILYRRGRPPHQGYVFKHALLQDAAYGSLLRSDRQRFHRRIAERLESHLPAAVEGQPEVLAHHYTEAGMAERAVPLWRSAGERAVHASAYPEAIGHFERALALLAELPEGAERDLLEIPLQVALGVALAVRSYALPEVERAYSRGLELCRRAGATAPLFPALRGINAFYLVSGRLNEALAAARELHAVAVRAADPLLLQHGHQVQGFVHMLRGELAAARACLEAAIALDPSGPGVDQGLVKVVRSC